jgi:hypothetical protein
MHTRDYPCALSTLYARHHTSMYDCADCAATTRKFANQITHLNGKIKNLEDKVIDLTKKLAILESQQTFSTGDVFPQPLQGFHGESQYVHAKELELPKFAGYLSDLIANFPILNHVMDLCTSSSHQRKLNAKDTHDEWIVWSGFYRSFIADTFLRSRFPKSVMRTNLALGLFFTLVKIPDPAWRILERLRIVTSRDTIEKYVNAHPKIEISQLLCLIFSFDNCDFWKKVTHMRTCNQSEMIHVINAFLMHFRGCASMPVDELYEELDAAWFGDYIQGNGESVQDLANLCLQRLIEHSKDSPLRFAYRGTQSYVLKSNFTILPSEFGKSTKSRADVESTLANFHTIYIQGTTRTWAFVSGDEQVYAQIYNLKRSYPDKYGWMIPVPGEFHWTWHVLKGIFHVWGTYLLVPFSRILGLTKLDLDAKVFHMAEDILQQITFAILSIMREMMRIMGCDTAISLMHRVKGNSQVYELLYACIYYFAPYFVMRSSIKWSKSEMILEFWRYWLHMFIDDNKYKYAIVTLRFLHTMKSLNHEIAMLYSKNRVLSMSGDAGTGMPVDAFNELVRFFQI